MKLAMIIYNYSPFGGLERDFNQLIQVALAKGHQVVVFTMQWQGERNVDIDLRFIKVSPLSNHGKAWQFSQALANQLAEESFDLVVGFNKTLGLDVYFSGDPCFKYELSKRGNPLLALLPRYRTYLKLEQCVVGPGAQNKIITINDFAKKQFQECYDVSDDCFYQIKPAIDKQPVIMSELERRAFRLQHGVPDDCFWLLAVGSNYKRKGMDRVVAGLKHLSVPVKLSIVGKEESWLLEQAKSDGLGDQVTLLGERDDTMAFMAAADCLVHPARQEPGGKVLIEALISGCVVLTTENCGYASYIKQAEAGIVLEEPFLQAQFNEALTTLVTQHEAYRSRAAAFKDSQQFYTVYDTLISQFESWANHEIADKS